MCVLVHMCALSFQETDAHNLLQMLMSKASTNWFEGELSPQISSFLAITNILLTTLLGSLQAQAVSTFAFLQCVLVRIPS